MTELISKKELSTRLRNVLDELEEVCDQVILTPLVESGDSQDDDGPAEH